jgi:hypothetical protein
MALSDSSKTLISIKKLVGKAHTSNDKDVANEALPSGVSQALSTVFAQSVPAHTGSAPQYQILSNSLGHGVVEFLRLSASFVAGSDTDSGRHGFYLQLPDDYESKSKNPLAGTDPFLNRRKLYLTTGSLQLVPPSFDADYEATPYHSASNVQTQIPVLDARDWYLDYFNGIFFQQDPPGTGDHANNPRYIDAFLYVGDYVEDGKFKSGLSGSLTNLADGTSYLAAGDNVTITSASNGQVKISASSGNTKTLVFNEKLTGTANGSNTFFTLANTPSSNSEVSIFLNGQLLTPAGVHTFQDYSVTGSNVFFSTGSTPESGDLLLSVYYRNT